MQTYRIWKGEVVKRWFLETKTSVVSQAPWSLVDTFDTYEKALREKVRLEKIELRG